MVQLIGASELPPAHAGVHAGALIERDGDYFGNTVNIAARISTQAGAGEVLTSQVVAESADSDLDFVPRGSRDLKGLGPTPVYGARWRDTPG